MSIENKQIKVSSLEKLELSNKPTLVITERLKYQIDFLHEKIGNNEWSGELITREEGTINNLDDWKIYAEDIFLADIGNGTFTGYEVDKGGFKAVDIIELYDTYPQLLDGEKKIQHIHTHHSMGTFFSGTDWENLHDRSLVSNYFMMLIVNKKGDYCAKVAFKAKKQSSGETKLSFANNNDGFSPLALTADVEKEVLVVMDCKLEYETPSISIPVTEDFTNLAEALSAKSFTTKAELKELIEKAEELLKYRQVGEEFEKRYVSVKEAIEEEEKKKKVVSYSPGYTGGYNNGGKNYSQGTFDDTWNNGPAYGKGKKKGILDMTDREWNRSQYTPKMKEHHMFQLINAMLDKNSNSPNYTNPISRLIKKGDELKSVIARANWINEFFFGLRDKFDMLFSRLLADDEDYWDVLSMFDEKLRAFKSNKFVEDILEYTDREMLFAEKLIGV